MHSSVSFLCRLVEYDSNTQEEVSKMSQLIDKLLFITDRCQSEPAGYALCSSQDASNNLLCCTWNVKSAQPLVDCGALEKMVNITKNFDKDSDTLLRWEDILQNVRDLPFNFRVNQKPCNHYLRHHIDTTLSCA